MKQPVVNFSIKLIVLLIVVFGIHLLILYNVSKPLFGDKIILSYVINIVMAIFIFWFLDLMKTKYKEQLGFIFIFGSFLKFTVFFIVFNYAFKADGNISATEFASFFVPYVLCLIMETYYLSKWLNKMS